LYLVLSLTEHPRAVTHHLKFHHLNRCVTLR